MTFALMLAVSSLLPSTTFAAPTFANTYPISSTYNGASQMTVAGDALWYLEATPPTPGNLDNNNHYIAKMTTTGVVIDYDVAAPSGSTKFTITSLATGSDGNVWFNGVAGGGGFYIGMINVSTGAVTYIPSPVPGYSYPGAIVSGADGKLWYSVKSSWAQNYTYLVSVDPSTQTAAIGRTLDAYVDLVTMTNDEKGNLWYSDSYNNRITSINPSTGSTNSYNLPTPNVAARGMAVSPDGSVWMLWNGVILKMASSGAMTQYTPPPNVVPDRLSIGFDGAVWFANTGAPTTLGRISGSGVYSTYSLPTGIAGVNYIVRGPDGGLWFSSNHDLVRAIPSLVNYPVSSSYTNAGDITSAAGSMWYIESPVATPTARSHIGNMTMSGITTDYDIRALSGYPNLSLTSLATGSDGNIWFNGLSGNFVVVGNLNISTGVATSYLNGNMSYSSPSQMVAGSDGNLYYYYSSAGSPNDTYLMRVDPATGTRTVKSSWSSSYSNISSIAGGTDGKIWVTDSYIYSNKAQSIAVAGGTGSSYTMPTSNSSPTGITAGGDGNMWLREGLTGKLVKVVPGGSATEYVLPSGKTLDFILGAGPDDATWLTYKTNSTTRKLARVTSTGLISEYITLGSVGLTEYSAMGSDSALWISNGANLTRFGF